MAEATEPLTPLQLTTNAARPLAAAGIENPVLDAQLLLAHALATSRERLLIDYRRPVDADDAARFGSLVARRMDREPVAYILGRRAFRHIELAVDQRVLVPRPETELLVEVGISLQPGARVVDVGTGSGAVALALKDERPDLEVWATDVSADALAVARENADRLGLEVRFVNADLLDGIPESFDAVLANLPYVELGAALEPEISQYEPAGALFAGADGLDVIRRLAGMLGGVPLVALEVGAGQADQVAALLRNAGFLAIDAIRDLAGHDRVVVGSRGGSLSILASTAEPERVHQR